MQLQAKPIITWCDVNRYTYGNQWTVNSGDPLKLYFQIVDVDQAIPSNGPTFSIFSGVTAVNTTAGLRYLLGIGSQNQPFLVKVTFPSIDPNQLVTYTAVQADPNDSSLWVVTVPASQAVSGGNVQFSVYEGSNIRRFTVQNMLAVLFPTSVGLC